jgi:hypothetical protein
MSEADHDFERLVAYESGEMSDDEAENFERALFDTAAAGGPTAAGFVDHVGRISKYLLPRGGFDIGSSRARVDALIAAGHRVQVIVPNPEDYPNLPRIDDDAEIVATHVPIDVRGYDSVDVELANESGRHLKTFRDIGWDPVDGTVYAVCEAPLARLSASQGFVRSTIIGHRAGQRHVIATFDSVTAQ